MTLQETLEKPGGVPGFPSYHYDTANLQFLKDFTNMPKCKAIRLKSINKE